MSRYSFESKLERAEQHLQTLKDEIERWLATSPWLVSDEFDSDRALNIIRITPLGQPPPSIPLLIGDCLHNLRSTLDHLAFSLSQSYAAAQSKTISERGAKRIEFPIFFDAKQYLGHERDRRIGWMHPDAQAVIDGLQPHHAGDAYVLQPLWQLGELSNIDKHRVLHFAATAHVQFSFGFKGNTYTPIIEVNPAGPLEGETEVARYRAMTLDRSAYVKMNFTCDFSVSFADGPTNGQMVGHTLQAIRDCIADLIIPELRPFLDPISCDTGTPALLDF